MVDSFVFSNRAVTALQDSVDQFATVFDFGIDDLDRFPELAGGSKFPIILSDREDVFEICYVTALSAGGEATVERAKEGTAALSWSAGTFVEHCLTAGSFLNAARLVPKGTWSAATNYLPGDVVVYTGISYIASASSLNQVPSGVSAYWQVLYQPPGASSTALTWSGDWNSGTTYAIGAYVKYQGKLYVAVAAGLNHLPSDASWWYPLGTPPDAVTYDNVLTGAGTNNYTVAPSPAPTALFDGMELSIVFTNTNTAAATLAVGALAPAPLRPKAAVDFAASELPAGVLMEFVYRSGTGEFLVKGAPIFAKQIADLVTADTALDARLDAIEASTRWVSVGASMDFWGDTPDAGWLLMYGQAISQATYPALYTKFGTKYNTGGEAGGTFRIPDCRGRVTAGQDDMGGSSANRLTNPGSTIGGVDGDVLGATGGEEAHVQTVAQIGTHTHIQDPHQHNYTRVNNSGTFTSGSNQAYRDTDTTNTTNTTATNQNTGSSAAFNVVQPTIICNKILWTGVP